MHDTNMKICTASVAIAQHKDKPCADVCIVYVYIRIITYIDEPR
jgi:hypothetical protein